MCGGAIGKSESVSAGGCDDGTFPVAAEAHPHVFIDAGVEVIFDAEGRAEALRVTWIYDEFYSLMIAEERGLDPDYDGTATPDKTAGIVGF